MVKQGVCFLDIAEIYEVYLNTLQRNLIQERTPGGLLLPGTSRPVYILWKWLLKLTRDVPQF